MYINFVLQMLGLDGSYQFLVSIIIIVSVSIQIIQCILVCVCVYNCTCSASSNFVCFIGTCDVDAVTHDCSITDIW